MLGFIIFGASSSSLAKDEVETIVVSGNPPLSSENRDAGSAESVSGIDLDKGAVFDLRNLGGRVPGLAVSTNTQDTQDTAPRTAGLRNGSCRRRKCGA